MSLTYKQSKNVDLSAYPGQIPVNFKFTYGIAGEEFFRALMDKGKFLASPCEKCGVTYIPTRIFCEQCLSHLNKTVEVSGKGEVHSFTVCHVNMDGSEKKQPVIIAAIEMDGTDGTLVHFLDGIDPCDVEIGMLVEPVLKAKKDREGSIYDIKHFKPLK